VQFNVINRDTLIAPRRTRRNTGTSSSASQATAPTSWILSPDLQDDLIARTEHGAL
jgi:hypothetical protein